jgi:signal transduction histidine kinase
MLSLANSFALTADSFLLLAPEFLDASRYTVVMTSLLWLAALSGLAVAYFRLGAFMTRSERGFLGGVAGAAALAVTLALYPSDPRGWSLASTVLYLTWPKLELPYFLGNLLIGSALFSGMVAAIYWANRR